MPGFLVVLLWLAAGGVATWLIGREEIRRGERRAESRSRDKVKQLDVRCLPAAVRICRAGEEER